MCPDRAEHLEREPPLPLDSSAVGTAVISACARYRYELTRTWNPRGPRCCWLLLNPSVADAERADTTLRRLIGFARVWGYGGLVLRNLFALRATDPRLLRTHPDPIGPDNDAHLLGPDQYTLTVCGWGAHGSLADRADYVRTELTRRGVRLHHLGVTRDGQPRHPLYLPASAHPEPLAVGGST